MGEKVSVTAEEVIDNTIANRPRTVDGDRIISELQAAGYKIVPRDPTNAMAEVGGPAGGTTRRGAWFAWQAMWDAAL